jgi:hypothetical protein
MLKIFSIPPNSEQACVLWHMATDCRNGYSCSTQPRTCSMTVTVDRRVLGLAEHSPSISVQRISNKIGESHCLCGKLYMLRVSFPTICDVCKLLSWIIMFVLNFASGWFHFWINCILFSVDAHFSEDWWKFPLSACWYLCGVIERAFQYQFAENVCCGLIGPFMLEQCVTADNCLNFLANELWLLMEDMPLETRHGIFLQHDGVPPCFGCYIMAYLNQCYQNHGIGCHGPVPWLLSSLYLSPFDFFLWILMRDMTCRTKLCKTGTLALDCGCCSLCMGTPQND